MGASNTKNPPNGFGLMLLGILVFQNTFTVLMARYTRTMYAYEISHMLLMAETIKFVISFLLEQYTTGNVGKSLKQHNYKTPANALVLSVPALLYFGSNTLVYVAISYLAVPLFQIVAQTKLVTTALLSIVFLQRSYSWIQWGSILTLCAGVTICIMGQRAGNNDDGGEASKFSMYGLTALAISNVCGSLAGVYFEKVIKKMPTDDSNTPASLWMRNMQLAFFTILIATLQEFTKQGSSGDTGSSFFNGFAPLVWLQICFFAAGGLLVAIVVKYTDSVQKGLATGVSVILSSVLASLMEHTNDAFTLRFAVGATLAIGGCFCFSNVAAPASVCCSTSSVCLATKTLHSGSSRGKLGLLVVVMISVVIIAIRDEPLSRLQLDNDMTPSITLDGPPSTDFLANLTPATAETATGIAAAETIQTTAGNGTSTATFETVAATADWILPADHVRPDASSLMAQLWPQFDTKMGPWEPVLHRRPSDGHLFLLTLIVEQIEWMDLVVNFIYSLRLQGIYNVTITTASEDVMSLCTKLDISFYNETDVYKTVSPIFQPLPDWSWGKLAWMRVATTLHAIRQGVGSCHFDVDTTIANDVFFSHPEGPFDMTMQGRGTSIKSTQSCNLSWNIPKVENNHGKQFYINPGFACFAANERTALVFDAWRRECEFAIQKKFFGWLQPAFNNAACKGDFRVKFCNETECQVELTKYKNASILAFLALNEADPNTTRAHAVHSKGCHGAGNTNMGNPNYRHQCKIDGLRLHNSWYAPFELPLDREGWKNVTLVKTVHEWIDAAVSL